MIMMFIGIIPVIAGKKKYRNVILMLGLATTAAWVLIDKDRLDDEAAREPAVMTIMNG